MTRSFGDECASRVGVNAEPGKYLYISYKIYYVKKLNITNKHKDTEISPFIF